jgi:hypothetical protein
MTNEPVNDAARLAHLIRSPSRVPGEFLLGKEAVVTLLIELRDTPGWRSPADAPREGQFLGWNGSAYFIGSYTADPQRYLYPDQDSQGHFVADDGIAQPLLAWAPLRPPHLNARLIGDD